MTRLTENSIGLYTIVRREVSRFIRIWSQTLLPSVVTMALYFVIFGNVMGSRIGEIAGFSYIEYIVPGLIMMAIITNSYGNVVASFFSSKFQRNIEEMLVSPLPNFIIIWGYLLGGLARGVTVGILVTGVSLFFVVLPIAHMGVVFFVGILTAILFSLAGLINGIFAKSFDDINIVPTFVLTPLTYLGGVFYSLDFLPHIWQWASYGNPVFYMVNAFRYGMLGQSDIDIHIAIGIIIGFIVVFYSWAIWLFRKGVGIKT